MLKQLSALPHYGALPLVDVWILRYWHNRKNDFSVPAYLFEDFGRQIEKKRKLLIKQGYLTTLYFPDDIASSLYTIPQVEQILGERGIPYHAGAKKEDLMRLVLESFPFAQRKKWFPKFKYAMTPKGAAEVQANQFYLQIVAMNVDLPAEQIEYLRYQFSADGIIRDMEGFDKFLRYQQSLASVRTDFAAYFAAGTEEYEFMASLNDQTCRVCGALDGKHFKVSEARIGVNCPPMHPGCRCTTVGYDPEEALDWLNSGVPMPERMTYTEWKNGKK